jgi:lipopolysaccharide biosynthesis regulator YciM
MRRCAAKDDVKVLKVLCQYVIFGGAAVAILFLKGIVTLQTPTLRKQVPLFLFCEMALLAIVSFIILYNCWNCVWNIPRRLSEFRKNMRKRSLLQNAVYNAQACALKANRSITLSLPSDTDQDFWIATICCALSADICARWKTLEECAGLMVANEQLKTLGHLYMSKVHKHNQNYREELQELLLAKDKIAKEFIPILKDRLFLAFIRNVPHIDGAELILSPQQMSVLLSETGKTFPEKYVEAYRLDPNNVDAACFLASKWNESIAAKRLIYLLKILPDIKVLDKIMQINTQLNRTEIYERIRSTIANELQSPEESYILARAAFAAGLRGEGIHYAKQASSAFHPLISPRLREVCESDAHISGKDVYECNNCHYRVMLRQAYCPQCARINTFVWRVVSEC